MQEDMAFGQCEVPPEAEGGFGAAIRNDTRSEGFDTRPFRSLWMVSLLIMAMLSVWVSNYILFHFFHFSSFLQFLSWTQVRFGVVDETGFFVNT